MYDAQDYPDVTEIRRRFRFEVSYRPITDVGDFRLHLQDEEFSLLKAKVSEQAQSNIEELMAEPLRRLRDVVSRLHDTAGKGERAVLNPRTGKTEVKPPIFRDTVCENIIHEINLLSDFAAIMPENIVQLANDAKLKIPSADMLRNSQVIRDKTVENTSGLLDAINSLLEE
jgi:predicted house-cleaning noncanonical NTP pyrophosphatase (MazG superfamily)